MDGGHNGPWSQRQPSPLRERILQESRAAAQEYHRKPQQKHYRAPDFPGTAAFDLKNGLREIPYAKRKRAASPHPLPSPIHLDDNSASTIEEMLKMSPDEYHATIVRELDSLEDTARSNTPAASPRPSGDSVFGNGSDSQSETVAEPLLSHKTICSIDLLTCDQDSPEPSQPAPKIRDTPQPEARPTEEAKMQLPPTRPITEQQLINELKGIYAGLVMVERRCQDILHQQSEPTKRLSDQQWKALIALHTTLLHEYHDFFVTTNHPSASPALKFLATKYAMPKHMWHESMHQFLELLRRRSPSSNQNLILFGNLCAESMQKLIEHVPRLSEEWDLIKDNLHEYFTALRADGFDISSSLINHWDCGETSWTRLRKTYFPPMRGHFFGDEDLPDWLLETHLPSDFWKSLEEPDDGSFGGDSLQGVAQLITAGWLQYGRKIATSYHVYSQVAIFLAVTIFTSSLIS